MSEVNESYDSASESAYIARAKAHSERIEAGATGDYSAAVTLGIEWLAAEMRAARLLEQELSEPV